MENQVEKLDSNLLTYSVALYADNKTYWEVKEALKEKGVAEDLAEKIADQSQHLYTDAVTQKANKNILWGSVWFIGGLLITIVSMGSGGRSYVICYGAILGGVIQLISGLVQRSNIN